MGAQAVCAQSCCSGCDPPGEENTREQFQAGYVQSVGISDPGGAMPDSAIGSLAGRQPHPRPWSDSRIVSDPRDLIPVLRLPRAAQTPNPFMKPPANAFGGAPQAASSFSTAQPEDGQNSDNGSIPGELSEEEEGADDDDCSVPSELSGDETSARSAQALPEAPIAGAAAGGPLPQDLFSEGESTDFDETGDTPLWTPVPPPPPPGAESFRPPGDEPVDAPAEPAEEKEEKKEKETLPKKGRSLFFRTNSNASSTVTFDMFGFEDERRAEIAKRRAEMSVPRRFLDTLGVEVPDDWVLPGLSSDLFINPGLEEPDEVFKEQDALWAEARADQIKRDLKEIAEQQEEGVEFTALGFSITSPHKRGAKLGPILRRGQRGFVPSKWQPEGGVFAAQ